MRSIALPLTRRGALASGSALAFFGATRPARAQLELDITRGFVEPTPVAVSPFAGATADLAQIGQNIRDVIAADLDGSGFFETVDQRAYIQSPAELIETPRFADWRQINVDALATGEVTPLRADELRVDFRLWDVFGGDRLRGLRFEGPRAIWRRIAHQIADQIYERMTGEEGYFDSRIAYIAESGPLTRKTKQLAVMDQDGGDHRFLTDGAELVLTPRFDRSGANLAYLIYRGRSPRLYIRNLDGGRANLFGDFPGMTFSPRFAPDGRSALVTIAQNGNSDIYAIDLGSRRRRRITTSPAIDTSPSFSPDGSEIVFNSDRGGAPQLYMMSADGGGQRRISFGAGRYGSPNWSPKGDLIAFTKIKDGLFHIGVMRPDGGDERLLTRSFLDEGPSWAPNGRVIVFSRQDPRTDRTRLFSIDVSGYNLREIPTPLDASDPAWSPLIT